ncbi:MAG: sugar ABC transporter permease [Chloroflexi bacterium]|nr:sugar ABC transporter permease [Chloroflexota bacterium]
MAYRASTRTRIGYILDRETWLGPVMLFPAVLYILVLVGLPFLLAILYSLSDITVGDPSLDFVGLQTIQEVVENPVFQKSLRNTFVFTLVSQALVLVLGKILALALSTEFRGKWIFRFLILLPWTTPIALATISWLWMLDSVFSPIDWMLRAMNLLGPGAPLGPAKNLYWLGKPELAFFSVILVHTWRMLPLATVIMVAGLTSIPQDIKDAVAVDGASFWRALFEITIPLMLPIMAVATLFGVIFTFTDMIVIYVLTRGGPIDTTQVLSTWAFFKGIEGGNLAQGAATALFLFPVLLGVAVLILRFARRAEVA